MNENINVVQNVDCLKGLKTLSDNSVDMILTSPPYDDIRYYGSNKKEINDFWNYEVFKNIAEELTRVLKEGGIIVWVVGDSTIQNSESGTSFKQALYFKEDCKLNIHDTMIYEKNSFSFPAKGKYNQIFEYMFIFSKGKPKTFNPIKDRANKWFNTPKWGKATKRGKEDKLVDNNIDNIITKTPYGTRNNIWKYSTGGNASSKDKIAFQHPAIFPERLAIEHILSWSNENDIILDPFSGSGTTLKCAKILNRNYIGFELNSEYFNIINERIKNIDIDKENEIIKKEYNKSSKDLLKTLEKEQKDLQIRIDKIKKSLL
jgi:site-specific DNA-methyltransferase (adenine-specific)